MPETDSKPQELPAVNLEGKTSSELSLIKFAMVLVIIYRLLMLTAKNVLGWDVPSTAEDWVIPAIFGGLGISYAGGRTYFKVTGMKLANKGKLL